jgi:ABC-type nitrate/sulfonate/bicarbonate transport system substrate-binding protein
MNPSRNSRAGPRAAGATLLMAILVLVACLSPHAAAQALKPVKVLLYPGLIHQQNLRVAIGAGIFKKHGLDVTLVQVENGPAGIAAVQGGSIDFGVADSNLPMLSNVKGSDFQIVCGASGLYFAAIAGPKLALPSLAAGYPGVMKDFVGKNLGVTGLGASSHFFWLALFKGAGIDPASATYVPVGLAASAVQALRQQRIDAYMGFDPVITIVRDGGLGGAIAVDTRAPANQGPREITQIAPQLTFYAKRSYLSANADIAKAFNDALIEAAAWQKVPANLDKVVEIMKPTASIGDAPNGDAVFRKMIQENIPVASQTKLTKEGLVAWIKFMQEYASYPKDIDADKTINDLVYKGACS